MTDGGTRDTEDATLDILEGSADRGRGRGQALRGNPPPPPPPCAPISIEELLVTKNELMSVLVHNEACHGPECPQHHQHQDMNTSYSDFMATHPLIFSGANGPLDTDDWLRTTESKFGMLHSKSIKILCMPPSS
jgi:hypothetical protein